MYVGQLYGISCLIDTAVLIYTSSYGNTSLNEMCSAFKQVLDTFISRKGSVTALASITVRSRQIWWIVAIGPMVNGVFESFETVP